MKIRHSLRGVRPIHPQRRVDPLLHRGDRTGRGDSSPQPVFHDGQWRPQSRRESIEMWSIFILGFLFLCWLVFRPLARKLGWF